MTEHQQPDAKATPAAPAESRGRSPQEALDELLASLPTVPWDKNDPDPLIQLAIRLSVR